MDEPLSVVDGVAGGVAVALPVGVPEGVAVPVAVLEGVTESVGLGVALLLSETDPVLEALAPAVSDAVRLADTVDEPLSVVDGVAGGVPLALLVAVPEGVTVSD